MIHTRAMYMFGFGAISLLVVAWWRTRRQQDGSGAEELGGGDKVYC